MVKINLTMQKCKGFGRNGCGNTASYKLPYATVCFECFEENRKHWNSLDESTKKEIREEWRIQGIPNPFEY